MLFDDLGDPNLVSGHWMAGSVLQVKKVLARGIFPHPFTLFTLLTLFTFLLFPLDAFFKVAGPWAQPG